jgi:hypothetical protein
VHDATSSVCFELTPASSQIRRGASEAQRDIYRRAASIAGIGYAADSTVVITFFVIER